MAYSVRNGTSRQHDVQIAKVFCVSDVHQCILDEFRSLIITAFIFVFDYTRVQESTAQHGEMRTISYIYR